jgi:hypothetical protein
MQKLVEEHEISSTSSYENLISAESGPLSQSPPHTYAQPEQYHSNGHMMKPQPSLLANHKNELNPHIEPGKFNVDGTPHSQAVQHPLDLYDSVINPKKSPSSIKSFNYPKKKKRGGNGDEFQKESIIIFAKFRKLFTNFENKTNMMAKDFENLSNELMERMEVFNQSKLRFDQITETTNKIEMNIDQNHLKIQKFSDALKWTRGKDFSEKRNRQHLRKKLGDEKHWLPFKSKKQVLKENLELFKGFYQKKHLMLER